MKTRSSSAVGQKLDLEFNPSTLRISDLADDAEPTTSSASEVFNKIRKGTTVVDPQTGEIKEKPQAVPVTSTINRDKLRAMGLTRDA
jgi:hypothetical protein